MDFFRPELTAEKLTVTGNLTIAQGMIAVKSGETTYIVPGLIRYAGFIDSLKDGAQVTLEGSAANRQEDSKTKILLASKMTIAGKEYDLSMPRATGQGQGRNARPRQGQDRQFQYPGCPCQPQPYSPRGRR